MDGALSVAFQRYHCNTRKKNQSRRVAEQVACFAHDLLQHTPVAVIKLPSEEGLHSNYNCLPTSGAAKHPLLPTAFLQAHEQKSQTGFIHFAATAQTSRGNSVGPGAQRQAYIDSKDHRQDSILAYPNLQKSRKYIVMLLKVVLFTHFIMNSICVLFFLNTCTP